MAVPANVETCAYVNDMHKLGLATTRDCISPGPSSKTMSEQLAVRQTSVSRHGGRNSDCCHASLPWCRQLLVPWFNRGMRYLGEALVFAFGDRLRFGGPFHGIVVLIAVVVVMLVVEAVLVKLCRGLG